jgi:hypothetical protein
MSILNRTQNAPEQIPPAKRVANRIKMQTVQTYQNLLQIHEDGIRSFWNNPNATPQEIATELGTDAAEVFSIHYKLGEFLTQFNADKVNESRALIGQFTQNEDGSVTINNTNQDTNAV